MQKEFPTMNTTKSNERPNGRYWTVPEIADRWQCSERHVRRIIVNGQLTAKKFGRLVRVSEANLKVCERVKRAD